VLSSILGVAVSACSSPQTQKSQGNTTSSVPAGTSATPAITISGNHFVSSSGKPVRLIGVNLGGTKQCLYKKKSSPTQAALNSATLSALVSWHVNTVRILVNESCWLGIDGEPQAGLTVTSYRQTIESWVSMAEHAGLETILSLYVDIPNGKGSKITYSGAPMPDAAHGPEVWTSLASTFKSVPGMIFDLYGEPGHINWSCWLNGCTIKKVQYVGMQTIVDTVRATGARQPLLLGGVNASEDISSWLSHKPTDPDHQMAADVHVYDGTQCGTLTCWTDAVAKTAQRVPVVTGEFGSKTCSVSFMQSYMTWADSHGVSYLPWAWITGACSTGGPLLANYSGQPSTYGSAYKDHVDALYQAGKGDVGSPDA
jgi:hypothetical protein